MTFDARAVLEEAGIGETIQEGWNKVRVEEVMQKTSAKGNMYVSVTLNAGGSRVWQNLNINHPNPKADDIARRELAQIMIAAGVNSVRDPANPGELVGSELMAYLEPDGSFMRAKQFKPVEKSAPVPRGMQESNFVQDDDLPF